MTIRAKHFIDMSCLEIGRNGWSFGSKTNFRLYLAAGKYSDASASYAPQYASFSCPWFAEWANERNYSIGLHRSMVAGLANRDADGSNYVTWGISNQQCR